MPKIIWDITEDPFNIASLTHYQKRIVKENATLIIKGFTYEHYELLNAIIIGLTLYSKIGKRLDNIEKILKGM